MPFKKGQSGNPAGKRKGTRSKTTIQLQKALLKLLGEHIDSLSIDLARMSPKDRVNAVIALVKHLTPPAVNPENLTVEQLEQLVEFLQNQKKQ